MQMLKIKETLISCFLTRDRMLKEIGHMRLLWAAATLIPFAAAFFLNWVFGSPGGWETASQAKLFFFFLQVGFITAYFCGKKLYKAAASLWGTVLFLWALSLVVPYLGVETEALLDMEDTTFEMSTPLYLFLSCLTAAWLLPGWGRMVMRIVCLIFVFLYIFIQFTYIGYFMVAHSLLSMNMLLALAQTNLHETLEFIEVNIPYAGLAAGILALLVLGWLIFRMSHFSFVHASGTSLAEKALLLVLFLANAGIAVISASGTQLSHIFYETKETLLSFREYQSMLEKRREMTVTDPDILQELRDVPDGVYVLIIGESLNRDHMNVYDYPRMTTPFQTEAKKDAHYTFFNHVYASYTQTVQVLTYALSEKNQYNDMTLPEAYSIIDMARAAGFTTTWISNQSRYGVWDTPIGAIGSTCDVQYWVNEYIGTGVITKDYDEALIPYLRKVDPENRRQLIVLHLMGSHVSYWDRYPSEYYHYPLDTTKERDTAQIMNDEYDNSVLYNDHVIEGIMDAAVNYLSADGVLYFSDHGEKVSERPGHNADMFDFTMVHVPFWTYTSDRYQALHPDNVEWMKTREHTPFTNDMLYDTFLGFMGIRAVHYDKRCDLFNVGYDKMMEQLMTMYGNIWVSKDTEGLKEDNPEVRYLTFPEDADYDARNAEAEKEKDALPPCCAEKAAAAADAEEISAVPEREEIQEVPAEAPEEMTDAAEEKEEIGSAPEGVLSDTDKERSLETSQKTLDR